MLKVGSFLQAFKLPPLVQSGCHNVANIAKSGIKQQHSINQSLILNGQLLVVVGLKSFKYRKSTNMNVKL